MPDDARRSQRAPRAARRAAVFGVLLFAVGAVAVCLRVFRSGLHPQIVLFLYSIPSFAFALSHQARARAMLDWRKEP